MTTRIGAGPAVEPEAVGAADEHSESVSRSRGVLWWLGVAGMLGLVGVALPALIADHWGALALPRSDDWSYTLSVFRWVDTGRLGFNNWAGTTLIGQLIAAAPIAAIFPRSLTAIHVASAVMSWLGLLAVVWMARNVVRDSWAVLIALTIGVSPLWLPMAPTFMTDNWAFAFEIASLALAFEAYRRSPVHLGWFAASLTVGFVAIAIRQYALVPVVACAIVAVGRLVVHGDRRRLKLLGLQLTACAIAVVLLLIWWAQRPTLDTLPIGFPTATRVRSTFQLDLGYLRLAGLLLAPIVVVAGPVRIARRAYRASEGLTLGVGLTAGAVLVLEFVKYPNTPFVGNYVTRSGVLGQDVLAGTRPDVIPAVVFDLLVWLSMGAAVVLLLAAVPAVARFWRGERSLRSLFAAPSGAIAVCAWSFVGFAFAFTFIGFAGLPTDDRYLVPVLPLVAVALLHAAGDAPERSAARGWVGWLAPIATLAVLLGLGVAFAAESSSFDATRWAVAERATKATGLAATQVDGGFEWVAWHRQTGPPVGRFLDAGERARQLASFEKPFCVRVAVAPRNVPSSSVVATGRSSALTRSDARVVAYRIDKPCPRHG